MFPPLRRVGRVGGACGLFLWPSSVVSAAVLAEQLVGVVGVSRVSIFGVFAVGAQPLGHANEESKDGACIQYAAAGEAAEG